MAGHPDVEGLCLALADWSAELRIINGSMANETRRPVKGNISRL